MPGDSLFEKPTDDNSILEEVAKEYPRLRAHLKDVKISRKKGDTSGRQIEYYPPEERDNPNPGFTTLEIYNQNLKGKYLNNAIAGDMLHRLGGLDKDNNPYDRDFYDMKQKFLSSRTPEQLMMDRNSYDEAVKRGDTRNYEDWDKFSRGDAYIRGYLFPDEQDNWKNVYSPSQRESLEKMRGYLKSMPEQNNSFFEKGLNDIWKELQKGKSDPLEGMGTAKSKDGRFMYQLPDDHPEKKAIMDLEKKYKVPMKELLQDFQAVAPIAGRNGDDRFAIVNPEEEALLKSRGGVGTPNALFPSMRQYYTDDGTSGDSPGVDMGDNTAPSPSGGGNTTSVTADPTSVNPDSGIVAGNVVDVTPDVNDQIQNDVIAQQLNDQLDPGTSKNAHTTMSLLGINSRGLSRGASIMGQAIAAVTGATAQGAVNAEANIGTGGQSGPAPGGSVSVTGGVNENTGPNSVSVNPAGPGGNNNPASFDTGLMSIAPGAMPPRTNRAQQKTNLLTYAMGLLPMGMV